VALVDYVCDPDAADFEAEGLASLEQFVPEGFIKFLE
jgi:hypothetical protein